MVDLTGAKAYQAQSLENKVLEATPHSLVALLLTGAVQRIVLARGHLVSGRVAEKGTLLSAAISIIEGLRSSLDFEGGGEIAANLNALYDYMERRLLAANLHNDLALLDEVVRLLEQIRSGWDGIAARVAGTPGNEP